ncbi:ISL3 family transposase [Methylobacterium sp. P1-11]|nr:ISL3 family transposase [Methylobacterium sp. P1-11]
MTKRLLPFIPADLTVDQVQPSPGRLVILARPSAATAACPTCGGASARLHSHYTRTLADLPWQGRHVRVAVRARRWRCPANDCPHRIFAERLPSVAMPWARLTGRLGDLQRHLGLALGGEGGARLSARLAIPTSGDTLLRLLRRGSPDEPKRSPRVLGIDDWAWRRGQRYGTILVDLERRRVVDLLPDREAAILASWLHQHPGAEIVARDCASATPMVYAAAPLRPSKLRIDSIYTATAPRRCSRLSSGIARLSPASFTQSCPWRQTSRGPRRSRKPRLRSDTDRGGSSALRVAKYRPRPLARPGRRQRRRVAARPSGHRGHRSRPHRRLRRGRPRGRAASPARPRSFSPAA